MADEKILIDMAKMLGALDSKLDSLSVDVRDFKSRYDQNAQTNRDHSIKVETRINDLEQRKLDRDDAELEPARKIGWIIRNWKWVLFVISLLTALGAKVWHERPQPNEAARETFNKVLKGGKIKP